MACLPDTLDSLRDELQRTQRLIDDLQTDWRQKVGMDTYTKALEPLLAHNLELLKLMTALALNERKGEEENRLTKAGRD